MPNENDRIDIQRLIGEVAARHRLLLHPDEPAIAMVTMNQLVVYLKAYIINSSPAQQDAFRSGFIASAVPNATAMFDQAMQQAAPRS